MTAEEILFFDRKPQVAAIYSALKSRLESKYPGMEVKVSRTQISFRNRHIFALASLPDRRGKVWPHHAFLLVSFGLSERKHSPRIIQAVEAYPQRWTHHVAVAEEHEIDEELLGWIDEAYHFAMIK
jgi:hypothetical protein